MTPIQSPSPFDTIAADLQMIMRGFFSVVGYWALDVPVMVLAHRRISRTFRELQALLARAQAGRLRVLGPGRLAVSVRRARDAKLAPDAAQPLAQTLPPAEKPVALPRRFGWIIRAGGWRAAGYGSQLRTVMDRPEMAALIAQSPQARRILRPLCRALMMDLPWVADKPRKPRVRKPRAKRPVYPEDLRSPLPRGAKTWSRREKQIEKALKFKHELLLKMAQERAR